LRIISPRRGAHAAPNLTIRVAVTGASAGGSRALQYVLDGRLTRLGSARLTFHDLAPGQHHLLVALLARPATRATVSFTVPAPPQPSPAPASASSSPQPAAPAPAPTAPSSPMTQPPAAPPAPPPSAGIPQGANAGDGDADNHGAPSDGDGNI
jgi:hypothetical protein